MTDQARTVLIGCTHSAGVALEELSRLGQSLPETVEWVSLPCGGGLDELDLLKAFESGAERVMVLACYDGACRSLQGSQWAGKRVAAMRVLLEEAGIEGWRLAFYNIAPTMSADLVQWLADWHAPADANAAASAQPSSDS